MTPAARRPDPASLFPRWLAVVYLPLALLVACIALLAARALPAWALPLVVGLGLWGVVAVRVVAEGRRRGVRPPGAREAARWITSLAARRGRRARPVRRRAAPAARRRPSVGGDRGRAAAAAAAPRPAPRQILLGLALSGLLGIAGTGLAWRGVDRLGSAEGPALLAVGAFLGLFAVLAPLLRALDLAVRAAGRVLFRPLRAPSRRPAPPAAPARSRPARPAARPARRSRR